MSVSDMNVLSGRFCLSGRCETGRRVLSHGALDEVKGFRGESG